MRRLVSRYTHVPLAAASVLVLAAVITWLLVDRLAGPWPWWRGLATPSPSVVAIPASPGAGGEAGGPRRADALPPGAGSPLVVPRQPAPSPEQFALESGPFTPGETADRVEGALNRLGHATVRFRKEDTTRLFVIIASGFLSPDEARQAVRELGRGVVVVDAGIAEVVVGRHLSLAEAVAAARPLRARGFEVRVDEALAPSSQYHIRYGQFARREDAQAYREALEERGIRSRVVKVR